MLQLLLTCSTRNK